MSKSQYERPELAEVLAPLRDLPLEPESAETRAATRAKVLPGLSAAVQALPANRAAASLRQHVRLASGVAAALAIAASVLWMLESGANTPQASESDEALALGAGSAAQAAADAQVGRLGLRAVTNATGDAASAQLVTADGTRRSLSEWLGRTLPGDTRELHSGDTAAQVRTAEGASLELAPGSRLALRPDVTQASARLQLLAGAVACSVPPLGTTRQFSIETADARVVVHGTRFSVRAAAAGLGTCVRVTEGVVAVHARGEVARLTAGQQWGCELPSEGVGAAAARGDDNAADTTAHAAQPRARKRGAARAPERGTLDAENALLSDAFVAERGGDVVRSRRLLQRLLRRYPDSPLAAEARAGLARITQNGAR